MRAWAAIAHFDITSTRPRLLSRRTSWGFLVRLGGCHQTRAQPGAPPHPPAQAAATGVGPAELLKLADVPAGRPDIGEDEMAAGAQHSGRLADRLGAGPRARN